MSHRHSARRAQQTADIVARELGVATADVRSEKALYLAAAVDLLRLIKSTGPRIPHLMIVGRIIDRLANRKLRHRELLLESSVRLYLHESVNAFLTTCPGQHSGISHDDCCYNVSLRVPTLRAEPTGTASRRSNPTVAF